MPRRRRAALVAAPVLTAAVLVVGCSEPTATPEAQGPEVATVMVDVPGASIEELNAAAEVVRARVMALDLQVGEIGWDDASIEVIVPAADEALARAALAPRGEVEFRPVLQVVDPSTAGTTTPVEERTPDAPVVAAREGGSTYLLGPAALDARGVESARASEDPGGSWIVAPLVAEGPDGIDALNAVAAACFEAASTCPAADGTGTGMLAILVDGTVVAAPTVNVAHFERDQIQISGTFDELGARSLAAALDGGPANVAWTVRD